MQNINSGQKIPINQIIRSRRRTLALVITPDAFLVVRAPLSVSDRYIENIVATKSRWIKRKIDEINRRPRFVPKQFFEGEDFFYLGKTYFLKLTDSDAINLTDYLEFPRKFLTYPKEHLFSWYKTKAFKIISERINYFSEVIGVERPLFKVTKALKRWGSCQSNDTLTFSYRLVMAPLEVIDYVVVHELAHIKQKNHSKEFWKLVKKFFPQYNVCRKWLAGNGHLLIL